MGASPGTGVDRALRVDPARGLRGGGRGRAHGAWGPFERSLPPERRPARRAGPRRPAPKRLRPCRLPPRSVLTFYPPAAAVPSLEDVLAAPARELRVPGLVRMETRDVSRDWVEGWKEHFRPIVVGDVRIRPPWEPALGLRATDGAAAAGAANAAAAVAPGSGPPVDVVINPGLGFGTGLHPTTRGTLRLLQYLTQRGRAGVRAAALGPVVDAGTGSGILAIAAAKLGWGPVFAFDNDPVALVSARENVEANGVSGVVEVHERRRGRCLAVLVRGGDRARQHDPGAGAGSGAPAGRAEARLGRSGDGRDRRGRCAWWSPASWPGRRSGSCWPWPGSAASCPGERVYEAEWVSLELLPRGAAAARTPAPAAGGVVPGSR